MFGQKISEGTSDAEYEFAKLTVNLVNGSNNASVFAQVLDAYAIQTSYDCSEYNTRTGRTMRTEKRQYYTDSKKKTKTSKVTKYYTSTYTYTTPNNQMSIVKSGDTMTFNWGGLTGKVTDDRLLDYRLTYVSVQYSD